MVDMQLGTILNYALRQRAWNSTGATFRKHCVTAINAVLADISARAPNAFQTQKYHTFINQQYKSTDSDVNATIEATNDLWVLKFDIDPSSTWTPTVNGSWNHVMHLEITRSDGVVERRIAREFWYGESLQFPAGYYVALDRQWRNTTDTAMAFRIYQPSIWLPGNATGIIPPVEVWDSERIAPTVLSAADFESRYPVEFQGDIEGPPEVIYPGRSTFMPIGPKTAPTLAPSGSANSWATTGEQEGSFIAYTTYFVGSTDPRWQDSPGSIAQDPIFESAPSPPSSTFAHSTVANQGRAIVWTFPPAAQMLGFYATSSLRHGRTGYGARHYIARTATRTAGRGDSAFNNIDIDGIPYLVGVSGDTESSFTWTGSVIPDRMRRLPYNTGYRAWNVYPNVDTTRELDLTCRVLPTQLVNDYDVVPLDAQMFLGFVAGVLIQLAQTDGCDLDSADKYNRRYHDMLKPFIRAHANPVGRVEQPMFGVSETRGPRTFFDTFRRT